MIIPALDIINGNTVRLYQGNYHMQSHYNHPILCLKQYINQGAKMIHLVDLSGAENPEKKQNLLIKQLIETASPAAKIQIGGGIRNIKDIKILIESGAARIVLGSIAITHPQIVKKWFKYFDPNILTLAIDIRMYSKTDQRVVIHGWKTETNTQLCQVIEEYNSAGLKHVLCTDISRDGTLSGSNIHLYRSICCKWPNILFQSSGGISTLTEISALRCTGVDSIIIGRAFLDKKFTVNEAISCWQNE